MKRNDSRGIGDEMAILPRLRLRSDTPGSGEFRIEKDPSRELHRPEQVGQRIRDHVTVVSGGSVRYSGVSVIPGAVPGRYSGALLRSAPVAASLLLNYRTFDGDRHEGRSGI